MGILLVDDHPMIRLGLAHFLGEGLNGLPVREAGSGEEAPQQVQEELPGLVIMDFDLPGISGLKPPGACVSACRNCACCFSANTPSWAWFARHWTRGLRVSVQGGSAGGGA